MPGSAYEFGHLRLTEDEIVASARPYDPQAIHTDPLWSGAGPFEGLIASGAHAIALCMRLLADHYISRAASPGSPGLDELRWPRPVRPGHSIRIQVAQERVSRSRPDRGLVHSVVEALNQEDEVLLSFTAMNCFA